MPVAGSMSTVTVWGNVETTTARVALRPQSGTVRVAADHANGKGRTACGSIPGMRLNFLVLGACGIECGFNDDQRSRQAHARICWAPFEAPQQTTFTDGSKRSVGVVENRDRRTRDTWRRHARLSGRGATLCARTKRFNKSLQFLWGGSCITIGTLLEEVPALLIDCRRFGQRFRVASSFRLSRGPPIARPEPRNRIITAASRRWACRLSGPGNCRVASTSIWRSE